MGELTPRQEKFLIALLDNPTLSGASEKANINVNTGRKWLRDETFDKEYKKMRREIMKQTTARLQYLALKATGELEKILDDEKASIFAKIQASQLILEKAYKGLELEDLQERLEYLEELNGVE